MDKSSIIAKLHENRFYDRRLSTILEETEIKMDQKSTNENQDDDLTITDSKGFVIINSSSNEENSFLESPGILDIAFYMENTISSPAKYIDVNNNQMSKFSQCQYSRNDSSQTASASYDAEYFSKTFGNRNLSPELKSVPITPSKQALSPNNQRTSHSCANKTDIEIGRQRFLVQEIEIYLGVAIEHGEGLFLKEINIVDISGFDLKMEIREMENLIYELKEGHLFDVNKAVEFKLTVSALKRIVKHTLENSPNHKNMQILVTNLQSKLCKLRNCKSELEKIQKILDTLDWLENLENTSRKIDKPPFPQSENFYENLYIIDEMEVKIHKKYLEMSSLALAQKRLVYLGAKLADPIAALITSVMQRYKSLSDDINSLVNTCHEERKRLRIAQM